MYDPADMVPGSLAPGELDAMPPHFAKMQEARPDFSAWRETAFATHGFTSHRVSDAQLRRDIAVYYGMISFMDAQIGRVLDALDRHGLAEDTLVVFTADHWHFLGQHGLIAKGLFHYEDLVRLPFLVRGPDVPASATSDALQSLVDVAPTFLAAAGFPVPGAMQGVDQWGVWRGEQARARDWAIVENRHQPTAVHLRTYIEGRYKATVYRGHDYGELFDLRDDPDERRTRRSRGSCCTVGCERSWSANRRAFRASPGHDRHRKPNIPQRPGPRAASAAFRGVTVRETPFVARADEP